MARFSLLDSLSAGVRFLLLLLCERAGSGLPLLFCVTHAADDLNHSLSPIWFAQNSLFAV